MAYFATAPIQYNGKKYMEGQEIPDFGVGKYDDILLESHQVESNGEGNGNEDRIANQKARREIEKRKLDSEEREEREFLKDVAKYQAEKDLDLDPELAAVMGEYTRE